MPWNVSTSTHCFSQTCSNSPTSLWPVHRGSEKEFSFVLLQLPTLTTVQKHSTCKMHYQCSATMNRSNKLNMLSIHIGCTTLLQQACAGCKKKVRGMSPIICTRVKPSQYWECLQLLSSKQFATWCLEDSSRTWMMQEQSVLGWQLWVMRFLRTYATCYSLT